MLSPYLQCKLTRDKILIKPIIIVTIHIYVIKTAVYKICFTATTIAFEHRIYNVNEDDERVDFVLVLSNPSSSAITVKVFNTDGSATGK